MEKQTKQICRGEYVSLSAAAENQFEEKQVLCKKHQTDILKKTE